MRNHASQSWTLRRLRDDPDVRSVLIVGVHAGEEARVLAQGGKVVTGVDRLPPYRGGYRHIRGRFEEVEVGVHDAAFLSHVLEHMEDVGASLRKLRRCVRPGGLLGLILPGYPQEEFFVGHYTLWTPCLALYNLVAAGWDCREARYLTTPDRRHIEIVTPRRDIENMPDAQGWDAWGTLSRYLPVPFSHGMNAWLPDRL